MRANVPTNSTCLPPLRHQFAERNAERAADARHGVNRRNAPVRFDEADHLPGEPRQFRQPVQRQSVGRAPLPDDLRQCLAHGFERGSRQWLVGRG